MGSENRRRQYLIPVRVSADERAAIRDSAQAHSLAPSALMRDLALRHRPKITIDQQAIHELARLRGDLGRLGGLLRMWLSDTDRTGFGQHLDVPEILERTVALQDRIEGTLRRL